jgi:L-aminopeptidase/D-esterase-like protein
VSASGPNNLITDVAGLSVGNAHDEKLRSGVSVVLCDEPMTAAVDVRGGGTGTRETCALDMEGLVQQVHGIVLSGGSAFGLDAATGVQSYLREKGQGFAVGDARVPIVPQAILFDLLNGGDKEWGRRPPYQDIGFEACENAGADFILGTAGAGYGATTYNLKGGLGSASDTTSTGITIGALAAVNAAGSLTIGETPHFWAAPFELGAEFGGHGSPLKTPPDALAPEFKGGPGESTTLVIIATDAAMDRAMLKRLAIMAQTGLARAIYPVHTPLDGDIVFAVSTNKMPVPDPVRALAELGAHAANVTARAIARAVYEARPFGTGPKGLPAYQELHPGAAI